VLCAILKIDLSLRSLRLIFSSLLANGFHDYNAAVMRFDLPSSARHFQTHAIVT
jgi:hypothetical protein